MHDKIAETRTWAVEAMTKLSEKFGGGPGECHLVSCCCHWLRDGVTRMSVQGGGGGGVRHWRQSSDLPAPDHLKGWLYGGFLCRLHGSEVCSTDQPGKCWQVLVLGVLQWHECKRKIVVSK